MYRREVIQLATIYGASQVLGCGANQPNQIAQTPNKVPTVNPPAAPSAKIVYFSRFGVNERMIQDALGVALAKGGDYADVFFQHKVGRTMALEDGEVNRAYASVDLGVGVRVVKGDQTGYGYTEDLTPEGLRKAAAIAATIADGPSRDAPKGFNAVDGVPARYA